MFNLENFGITTGRLTADPQIYDNADGSKKVRITVAAPNAYKNRDGGRGTQFIPLESFIPAERAVNGDGVFGMLHQGDKVTAQYSVRNNNYARADGERVYGIVLQIDAIRFGETRAVVSARQQAKAAVEQKGKKGRASKPAAAKAA